MLCRLKVPVCNPTKIKVESHGIVDLYTVQ